MAQTQIVNAATEQSKAANDTLAIWSPRAGDSCSYRRSNKPDALRKYPSTRETVFEVSPAEIWVQEIDLENGKQLLGWTIRDAHGNLIATINGEVGNKNRVDQTDVRRYFDPPLRVGKEWDIKYGAYNESLGESPTGVHYVYTQKAKVVGYETVAVEAGVFNTVHIRVRGEIAKTSSDGKTFAWWERSERNEDIWYSREVGCIVKYQRVGWSFGHKFLDYQKHLSAWWHAPR